VLAKLQQRYGPRGLRVLGFPCNDFANEEPDDLATIRAFMEREYGATYELFDKVRIKEPDTHPLYHWLTTQPPEPGPVRWNFEKFLIARDGRLAGRWPPKVSPDDPAVIAAIERALAEPRSEEPGR
jgi:glutathione peroxidase